ncbi:MAG: hypothetical protein ABIH11_05865 [Candidatus Altiarchaeota archaeon]
MSRTSGLRKLGGENTKDKFRVDSLRLNQTLSIILLISLALAILYAYYPSQPTTPLNKTYFSELSNYSLSKEKPESINQSIKRSADFVSKTFNGTSILSITCDQSADTCELKHQNLTTAHIGWLIRAAVGQYQIQPTEKNLGAVSALMDELISRCWPYGEGTCGIELYKPFERCHSQLSHLMIGYGVTQKKEHMDHIKKMMHCNFDVYGLMPADGSTMDMAWLSMTHFQAYDICENDQNYKLSTVLDEQSDPVIILLSPKGEKKSCDFLLERAEQDLNTAKSKENFVPVLYSYSGVELRGFTCFRVLAEAQAYASTGDEKYIDSAGLFLDNIRFNESLELNWDMPSYPQAIIPCIEAMQILDKSQDNSKYSSSINSLKQYLVEKHAVDGPISVGSSDIGIRTYNIPDNSWFIYVMSIEVGNE